MHPNTHARPEAASSVGDGAKLKFARDSGFHREIKRRVVDYFRQTGLSPRDSSLMYRKTALLIVWFGVSYGCLVFPRICHVHYPRIAEIVQATSAEFGVRYTVHEGLFDAISSHWRWLRRMGRPPAAQA